MTHTLTTGSDLATRPLAGDTLVRDGHYWQVRAADYGFSPAGIPNVTLTLWRDFASDFTIVTAYLAK